MPVNGVGQGEEHCHYDCKLPIATKQTDGSVTQGMLTMPTISCSSLPGLLGLTSLRNQRSIIDLNTNTLYFAGPGDYDLATHMPPGTDSFKLTPAPSGHLMLPCSVFSQQVNKEQLVLYKNPPEAPAHSPTLPSSVQEVATCPPPAFEPSHC